MVPRAISTAIVAVPGNRRPLVLHDRDGVIRFVQRNTEALDAELMTTELGDCLVATPEQTVLDLSHRPNLGDAAQEAWSALVLLMPRCDPEVLKRLAAEQRLGAALERAREFLRERR